MPEYKSIHTGPQIDEGITRALPGGALDVALSNKVNVAQEIPQGAALNEYTSEGEFYVPYNEQVSTIINRPPGLNVAFGLKVLRGFAGSPPIVVTQIITTHGSGAVNQKMWFRAGGSTVTWQDWQAIATATPPQWFPIQFQEGYQTASYAQYGQANGKLYIRGVFSATTEPLPGGAIFILPEGFRPSIGQNIIVVATGTTWAGAVDVHPDGVVRWNGHGVSPVPSNRALIFPSNTFVWL